jgi:hypothetical protein
MSIVLNVVSGGLQHQPAIARFGRTRFVASWAHSPRATIAARLFGADGQPDSDEFTVNAPETRDVLRHHPALLALPDGFVAAWIEEGRVPGGSRPHIKLQRFDESGRKVGGEQPGSSGDEVANDQAPVLTMLIDGGFALAWCGSRADRRILWRRFSPDGAPRGDAAVASTAESFHERPLLLRLESGVVALAWTHDPVAPGGGLAQLRLFDHDGRPESDLLTLDFAGAHALALLDDGRFVATHVRRAATSAIGVETNSVRAQVLNADGSPSGLPLFVSSEHGIHCTSPVLAGLPGGRFVASWLQKSAETFDTVTHLRAAVFSSQGKRLGDEVQVDAASGGLRFQARVATLFGGDAGEAVGWVWDDSPGSGDATDFDIRARTLVPTAGGGLVAG